ncbi:hypothetical protein GGI15_003698 [Coemansia interrupta]|uniref:Uncharacterized protein n=1 Tax=Coemansia interrupta TaxID=1126814 RepID=A0A9W8HCZ3_9FUNG|nr:hypothetical protein GGI15_003698 [Coemansia interrupta]
MRLLEHINLRAGIEWLLDRISADVLTLELGIFNGDSEAIVGIDELLGPAHGDQLTTLKLLPQRSARTRNQAATQPTNDKAPVLPPKRAKPSRKSAKVQDNSERALVLRRLVDALHDGDFDHELGTSKEKDSDDSESDADYSPDENADEDEVLEKKEKKLILRIKMSKIREHNGTINGAGEKNGEMRVEDVDWPEFDAETINGILQRREELRKQRGTAENMARLKKSSLAPPPLQLEKARPKQFMRAGSEEGEEVEGMEVDDAVVINNVGHDDKDSTDEGMLDAADQQQIPSHVPQSLRYPVPETERTGPPRDMRLELQNELQREEQVLKDLRAEIIDKLFKLQTEEKLLRMIVRHDFDIPDDEMLPSDAPPLAETDQMDVVDDQANPDYAAIAAAAAAAMELVNQSGLGQHDDADSDDASSLSGMSSSSSEDEIQDDEVTRGALSRVLDQYLPEGDWPNNSE